MQTSFTSQLHQIQIKNLDEIHSVFLSSSVHLEYCDNPWPQLIASEFERISSLLNGSISKRRCQGNSSGKTICLTYITFTHLLAGNSILIRKSGLLVFLFINAMLARRHKNRKSEMLCKEFIRVCWNEYTI